MDEPKDDEIPRKERVVMLAFSLMMLLFVVILVVLVFEIDYVRPNWWYGTP